MMGVYQWLRKKFSNNRNSNNRASNNQDKEVNETLFKLNEKMHETNERYSPKESLIRLYDREKKEKEINRGNTSYESHTEAFRKEIQVHSQEKIYLTDYLNIWLQLKTKKLQEFELDNRYKKGNLKQIKEELAMEIKINSEILTRCLKGEIPSYRLNQKAYQEMFGRIHPEGCQRNKVVLDFQEKKEITDLVLNEWKNQIESQRNKKAQMNECQTMEHVNEKVKLGRVSTDKAQHSKAKVQENPVRE